MDKQAILATLDQEIEAINTLDRRLCLHMQHIAHRAFQAGESYALTSLLTVEDVAAHFGITPRRVRAIAKHRHERFGVGYQVPGTRAWLFRPEELPRLQPEEKYRRKQTRNFNHPHEFPFTEGGNKMYLLDIYTWPAMQGVDPLIRETKHTDHAEALALVRAQTEPFAYAVLQKCTEVGVWKPCDWDGTLILDGETWPQVRGTNGEHPSVVALKADWDNLISDIRAIYATEGGAMIDIASRLLSERHPDVHGWADKLGWAAAG